MNKTPRNQINFQRVSLFICNVLIGLSAGFFATYQYSVTRALGDVDDSVYVATFQAINASIRSVEFGTIFFGSIVALAVALFISRSSRTTVLWLLAALCCYLTTLVITFSIHIPLNDALAVVDVTTPEMATSARDSFEFRWNEWHLLRTLSVVAAFVFTAIAVATREDRPVALNKRDVEQSGQSVHVS